MESIVSRHRHAAVEVVNSLGEVSLVAPVKGNGRKVMISASTFVKPLDIVTLEAMRTQRAKTQLKHSKGSKVK